MEVTDSGRGIVSNPEQGAHRATADKGVLWFDTAEELAALQAEVRANLDGDAP